MYDMTRLNIIIKKDNVTFYGYRQANLKICLVAFERSDQEIEQLENRLYSLTGKQRDNHVVFAIQAEGETIALRFSDDKMYLGLGVSKHSW